MTELFQAIYEMNLWAAKTSTSGLGSEIKAVQALVDGLPELCQRYDIKTLVDVPCGDGNWIALLNLPIEKYIGLDIVPSLIEPLINRFRDDDRRRYAVTDVTIGPLDQGDLVFCRDCLVHFSFPPA